MKIYSYVKKIILTYKLFYELYFFLSGKKINRNKIDSKIKQLLLSSNNLSFNNRIDDLIISLTSYGERLCDLKYTLFSLITQTIQPAKIIVWLSFEEKISNELKVFENFGVEFKFCNDTKSYKKLIPTLKAFPNKCIVTADDDIFYKKDWLKELWFKHLEAPTKKISHIAHQICFDRDKKLSSYNSWIHNVNISKNGKLLFPTGYGGILYPPYPVEPDFLNEELFMKLCPNADDVWFYFMGLLSGQETLIVSNPYNHLKYVDAYKEYGLNGKSTLQAINVEQNHNDIQIKNVMKYFNLDDNKLFQLIFN